MNAGNLVRLAKPLVLVSVLVLAGAAGALAQDAVFIDSTGNVGMGTSTPAVKLDVFTTTASTPSGVFRVDNGNASAANRSMFTLRNKGGLNFILNNTAAGGKIWNIGNFASGFVISIPGSGGDEMRLDNLGNLFLRGTLQSAVPAEFPDYVFHSDYELMPLDEVHSFIRDNGHLPGVPTSEDVRKAGGMNVSDLLLKTLEKVEELTLYVIDLENQIDTLKAEKADQ